MSSLSLLPIPALVVSLCACSHSSPTQTAAPIATPDNRSTDLPSLVGHHVHLEGRLDGPGKLADYVIVPGGEIYLTGNMNTGGTTILYHNMVIVEGMLGYISYPPGTQPDDTDPKRPKYARPPDHYFVENATVRMLSVNPADASVVGMTEAQARAMYQPKALDSGVIYWGGSGDRRLYFQLDEKSQVWFEIDGRSGRVSMAGGREPKTKWVRHGGDSITVE